MSSDAKLRWDKAKRDWSEDIAEIASGLLERGAVLTPTAALGEAGEIVMRTRAMAYAELLEKLFPGTTRLIKKGT